MSDILFPILGGGSITSGFGPRTAPTAGASTFHPAVDIAPTLGAGATVIAPTDMRVTATGYNPGNGNFVQGVDTSGNVYTFSHLQNNSISVQNGQMLAAGSPLGAVGSTGISTGPHLDFRMKDANGNPINPTDLIKNAAQSLGNTVSNLTGGGGNSMWNSAMQGLGKALAAPGNALEKTPVVGTLFDGVKGVLGLGSIWQPIIDWINQSAFFKRSALVILAIVLIGIGFIMLNSGTIKKTITEAAKLGA